MPRSYTLPEQQLKRPDNDKLSGLSKTDRRHFDSARAKSLSDLMELCKLGSFYSLLLYWCGKMGPFSATVAPFPSSRATAIPTVRTGNACDGASPGTADGVAGSPGSLSAQTRLQMTLYVPWPGAQLHVRIMEHRHE